MLPMTLFVDNGLAPFWLMGTFAFRATEIL